MTGRAASPRVTVVCIFLNEERFLREAVESVCAQDLADWELILVDDGSSDASGGIAAELASGDTRIRVVSHAGKANRGMSASRNVGAAAGTAPYVTFIDADDRWPAHKLSHQLAIMEAHPDLGGVAGAYRVWESWRGGTDSITECGVARDQVIPPPEALLNVYPLGARGAAAVSALIRRSVYEAVGGFEEAFRGFYEDQAFFVKLYANAPVWFSSETLLDYRQHPDSCCAQVEARGDYLRQRARLLEWAGAYLSGLDAAWTGDALAVVAREKRRLRSRRALAPVRRLLSPIKRAITSA